MNDNDSQRIVAEEYAATDGFFSYCARCGQRRTPAGCCDESDPCWTCGGRGCPDCLESVPVPRCGACGGGPDRHYAMCEFTDGSAVR